MLKVCLLPSLVLIIGIIDHVYTMEDDVIFLNPSTFDEDCVPTSSHASRNCPQFGRSGRGPLVLTVPIVQNPQSPRRIQLSKSESEPKVAMFITNQKRAPHMYDSNTKEIISQYLHQLPSDGTLITLSGESISLEGRNIDAAENEALAIVFHKNAKDIKTKAFCKDVNRPFVSQGAQGMTMLANFEELTGLFPTQWKFRDIFLKNPFAFIMFTPKPLNTIPSRISQTMVNNNEYIVSYFTKKYVKYPSRFALWGSEIGPNDIHSPGAYNPYFVMNVHGKNVRTWSLVINRYHSIKQNQEKIARFKNAIKLRSEKTLALSLQTVFTDRQLTDVDQMFKQTFPNLELISFNLKMDMKKYCVDSWIYSGDNAAARVPQLLFGPGYNCYLIIAYED